MDRLLISRQDHIYGSITTSEVSTRLKAEAVQMVMQHDRPIAQVAKELQINDVTLGNWVKLYREKPLTETCVEAVGSGAVGSVISRGS